MFSWQYGNSSLQVNLSGIPWSIETLQLEFLLSLSAQLSGTELRLQLHMVGTKDCEPRRMFTKKVLIPTLFFPFAEIKDDACNTSCHTSAKYVWNALI